KALLYAHVKPDAPLIARAQDARSEQNSDLPVPTSAHNQILRLALPPAATSQQPLRAAPHRRAVEARPGDDEARDVDEAAERADRSSATWEPRKPEAPVKRIFMMRLRRAEGVFRRRGIPCRCGRP